MNIYITENAIKHIKQSIINRGKGIGIRLGVKKAGCSGLAYQIEYADNKKSDDVECIIQDISIITNKNNVQYFDEIELDYVVQSNLQEGFTFKNPNAKNSCGCGKSFTI